MLSRAWRSTTMQKTVATIQRKKTISIAGICATCLTQTLAAKKASVDNNIERTPGVMIAGFDSKETFFSNQHRHVNPEFDNSGFAHQSSQPSNPRASERTNP